MAAVPGSLFRRILFWSHLTAGVAAGLLILVMSVTGVLLTYEHQMVESAARRNHVTPVGQSLDADTLASRARALLPEGARFSLVFDADPTAPVTVNRGRDGSLLLNPYTGEQIEDQSAGLRGFFRVVENWHRWMGGNSQGMGARLIDLGNLLFLFIILSGIYIWLPQVWRWRTVRGLVLFQRRYINAKVRDFNWHHVFGFWMVIPLLLISFSGVVMSYSWANRMVFAVYGEEPPARRGPPGAGPAAGNPTGGPGASARGPRTGPAEGSGAAPAEEAPVQRVSLETLRTAAAARVQDWQRMTLPVGATGDHVDVAFELRSTERRAPRQTVELDPVNGRVLQVSPPPTPGASQQTPGQRARTWLRFVHTGEQYGVIGQTIAGLASLAACFLVYTGLALAYRRLLRPLFRRAGA